jgi:dipeptidyl aminopeptidase/acylaminoacyl peptidase
MLWSSPGFWRYASGILSAGIFSVSLAAQPSLTPTQALSFRRIGDLHFSPDGSKLAYVLFSYQWDWRPRLYLADLNSGHSHELTPSGKSERAPQWSPTGGNIAFLSDRDGKQQVYVAAGDGGAAVAVTHARFGVTRFHWSPDAKSIAYLAKSDDAPAADSGPQVADNEAALSRLWVMDLDSKSVRRIGIVGYRISDFQWRSAAEILVSATDRPQVEQFTDAIYSVSVRDGATRLIGTPPQPFNNLLVSPDGRQFAVRSTLTSGPEPRDLLLGTYGHTGFEKLAEPGDLPIAGARWDHGSKIPALAIDGFINRLRIFSPKAAATPVELPLSVDAYDVSATGAIAYAGSTFDRRSELYIRDPAGHTRQLTHVHEEDVSLLPATIFRTKSFDGLEIESALLRPAKARRSDERWPLILLVHGGPASNFSSNHTWDIAWAQLLATNGYAVLMVNPRGSNGYSEELMEANRADWGGGDYRDLMTVLDNVIASGEIDPDRLGIGGWSYGGEMSAWAITQSNRFRASVVGAGVFNQQAEFESEGSPAGDEWYFGTPWEHADNFVRSSPATFIRNARTPTLILDGEDDRNNPVAQSKGLYRALKHFGVETQMVLYPDEGHSPLRMDSNLDMFERILSWYDRFVRNSR